MDKYNMSKEENIFFAKKYVVDSIWKSANLEGINITFPKTYAIYEKSIIEKVSIEDVNTILNLKHAWQLIFSSIDDVINLEYILKIHYEVSKDEALEWGKLRTGNVGISGTSYRPKIPIKKEVIKDIEKILNISNDTRRALELMCYIMKNQLFWDGNKRTAILVANKILISKGRGLISIPLEKIEEFNEKLNRYYTFDEKENLISFIIKNAINGLD